MTRQIIFEGAIEGDKNEERALDYNNYDNDDDAEADHDYDQIQGHGEGWSNTCNSLSFSLLSL